MSTSSRDDVFTRLSAEVDTATGVVDLPVELSWQAHHPWVVWAVLRGRRPVAWMLGRDLLADALTSDEGSFGDVWVRPADATGRQVALTLAPPSGRVCLRIDTGELARFLRATFARVPRGRELVRAWADLDLEIAALLDDPRSGGGSGTEVAA